LDVIVLFSVPIYYWNKYKKPNITKYFSPFFAVAVFSTILSFAFFPFSQVVVNSLYLVRLVCYYYFFLVVWNLVRQRGLSKSYVLNALVIVTLALAVFGWTQYLSIPDLTSLRFLGWDNHLYRMVGTFLDPTFTSIFLVFGFLLSLVLYLEKCQKAYILIGLFLLVSLLFTYTRAAYLALFFGLLAIFLQRGRKSIYILLFSIIIFGLILLFLPRMASEGTLLERTQSVFAKFNNYGQTIQIFRKYPVFGVGFNNLCPARIEMFGGDPTSHACPGADSSLLFVLATTGIVGFMVFLYMIYGILKKLSKDTYSQIFLACAVALFVHSLFVQSAFYSYVMGYMGIVYALSLKD
jgi:hypothetical protein